MTTRWKYLEHPGRLAFAHRGGSTSLPENTMVAFEHAIELGYTYLETDVRVTSDGVLVAFHDATLDRMTDRVGAVADLSWSELQAASISGQPIPRFEEILTAWPDARINVDPKCDEAVGPLVQALQQCDAIERVCIGAFSDSRIRECQRRLGPALCTSMGPAMLARFRAASFGAPLPELTEGCAQLPRRVGRMPLVDRRLVELAADRGLQIHVWTVNDESTMHDLLDLGVHGVMTDNASLLKDVLVARDQW